MTIHVPKTPEAAGAGAAMLAARAAGDTLAPLEIKHTYTPSERKDAYEEKYRMFRSIEKKLWAEEAQK